MNNILNILNNKLIFLAITLLLCFTIGKSITVISFSVPFIFIAGTLLVWIGLFNTKYAVILLIFAMLLSPEISIAKLARRDIVVRIEDILMMVFFFSWIAKMAIRKRTEIVIKTPLNKIILLYCLCTCVGYFKRGFIGKCKFFSLVCFLFLNILNIL